MSPDGVTVLVGQNESGKSSVLEAIALTASERELTEDDIRYGAECPSVELEYAVSRGDLDDHLEEFEHAQVQKLNDYLEDCGSLTCTYSWSRNEHGRFILSEDIEDPNLSSILSARVSSVAPSIVPKAREGSDDVENLNADEANLHGGAEDSESDESAGGSEEKALYKTMTARDVAEACYYAAPYTTLFNHDSGMLPNTVDINEKGILIGAGAEAATNYLLVAGLDVADLLVPDSRRREISLEIANNKITDDFCSFWSQLIGKHSRLKLQCSLRHYPAGDEKAGRPYLVFWIADGYNKLYPKQRSLGVRWFVSFYLQMKATERSGGRMFLLDEPGANLHPKAQADVLRLVHKLSKDVPVVYSTHSPHMIEYDKLYRVLAVQRTGDDEYSPTTIISAHHLGAASSDTLSPVLTAMGADLSQQEVIRRKNNVILEEMSGFYYLKAFWSLLKVKQEAHFIAATGVNKIEALANMFLGWGLDFIVAIDDEKNSRTVFNSLKKNLYGDDEKVAAENVFKFKSFHGIEDVFSTDAFKRFIVNSGDAQINGKNSEWAKQAGFSKPVLAHAFWQQVLEGRLTEADLDAETMANIKTIVAGIVERLQKRSA